MSITSTTYRHSSISAVSISVIFDFSNKLQALQVYFEKIRLLFESLKHVVYLLLRSHD